MKHTIAITTNPANPVNYLACCGLFDLLARMDAGAVSWWKTQAPVSFCLESVIAEHDFSATMLETLTSLERWAFVPPEGEPTRIEVRLTAPGGQDFSVPLDWWLETAELDGAIRDKSAWKMYAGNMSVAKTTRDLVAAANKCFPNGAPTQTAELLRVCAPLTGRFGFDFRSSRDGLDLGFIPNDLKRKETATFVIAELLALFGAASFFPSRCGKPRTFASTRGWEGGEEDGRATFSFFLWPEPLPVPLARLAAAFGLELPGIGLFSRRKKRGELANLTPAKIKHHEQRQ
jgi:hypothetical protein